MNTQELCLGVLHFGDASGYDIKQTFENTFSHFQNPGFGSIYPALEKLHKAGHVSSRVEQQDKRPAKKIYSLTDTGRERFEQTLRTTAPVEVCKSDFVFLAFFGHLLDPDRFHEVFTQHRDNISSELAKLEAIECPSSMPAGMRFSVDYGIEISRAQLRFIDKHLRAVLDQHARESQATNGESV